MRLGPFHLSSEWGVFRDWQSGRVMHSSGIGENQKTCQTVVPTLIARVAGSFFGLACRVACGMLPAGRGRAARA